jgi:hypothetical protein
LMSHWPPHGQRVVSWIFSEAETEGCLLEVRTSQGAEGHGNDAIEDSHEDSDYCEPRERSYSAYHNK